MLRCLQPTRPHARGAAVRTHVRVRPVLEASKALHGMPHVVVRHSATPEGASRGGGFLFPSSLSVLDAVRTRKPGNSEAWGRSSHPHLASASRSCAVAPAEEFGDDYADGSCRTRGVGEETDGDGSNEHAVRVSDHGR